MAKKEKTGELKTISWESLVGGPHFVADGTTLEKKEGAGFGAWNSGSLSSDTLVRSDKIRGVTWVTHVRAYSSLLCSFLWHSSFYTSRCRGTARLITLDWTATPLARKKV
jgi:hypothetical protein